MFPRLVCAVATAVVLAGCAVAPPADSVLPWRDQQFEHAAGLVTLSPDELFRLHPELARQLADPQLLRLRPEQRVRQLAAIVLGSPQARFAYEAGRTSVAADSWERRRGDCLSLAVLTYAAARALGLEASIQEVFVPSIHARRGGMEFVNHHVNLVVRLPESFRSEGLVKMVVDFDPDVAPGLRGQELTERQVLARVYNNLAVEFLAQGDTRRAYAHLKASIRHDPAHAPGYSNLAFMYRQHALHGEAEQLLRHAGALNPRPGPALRALVDLLQSQGRNAEAQELALRLRRLEESDPYHWIAHGSQELDRGHVAGAVRALERAQQLAEGFAEVHQQLAIAYSRLGDHEKVREQLRLLAQAENGGPAASRLKHKLFGPQ